MKKGRKSKKGKGAKNKSKRNRDIIKKSKECQGHEIYEGEANKETTIAGMF